MRITLGDDLATLLEAAEPGDVFDLEAGTHVLSRPITISTALSLNGEGGGAVLTGAPVAAPLITVHVADGVVFNDIVFLHERHEAGPNGGHDVVVVEAGEATLVGCRLTGGRGSAANGGCGLRVKGSATIILRACVAEGNEDAGLKVVRDGKADIEGCVFRGNAIGVAFTDRSSGMVRGSTAENNQRFGFMVTDQAKPTLVENLIRGNGAPGVAVIDDARPLVVDNKLDAQDMPDPNDMGDSWESAANDIRNPETVMGMIGVPSICLEFGANIIPLVDPNQGGTLMDRVVQARIAIAMDQGFIMPGIQFRDNTQLPPDVYRIHIHNQLVAQGAVVPGEVLATHMLPGFPTGDPPGQPTTDPVTGKTAYWVNVEAASKLDVALFMLTPHDRLILGHLTAVVRAHAHEILRRDEVMLMLDKARERAPVALRDLVPERLDIGIVHRVFSRLLREHVSIRDIVTVMEALGDAAMGEADPVVLTEAVRKRLARQICGALADASRTLAVLTFSVEDELKLAQFLTPPPEEPAIAALQRQAAIQRAIEGLVTAANAAAPDEPCALVVSATLRPILADFLAATPIHLPVLATDELHPAFNLRPIILPEISQ